MNALNSACNFIKKNSSAILTTTSLVGLVTTVGLAIIATKKAVRLLDSGKINNENKIRSVAPIYIPTFLSGLTTASTILGAHFTNMKMQASLISAYTFLSNSYNEYKNKITMTYGSEAQQKIIKDTVIEHEVNHEESEDECLFFDYFSLRYFYSTMQRIIKAEDLLNEKYFECGFVCLNDFYDLLGIPRLEFGYELGWSNLDMSSYDEYAVIDFIHEEVALKDGTMCYAIIMPFEPMAGYNR